MYFDVSKDANIFSERNNALQNRTILRVWVKQRTYIPLVSATGVAIFGKLSWPNLTFLTPHLAYYGSPHLAYFGPPYPA